MNIWDFSKCFDLAYLLLFAIYLLFKDNRFNNANYFLVVFLLVESCSIMNTFLWRFFPYAHIHVPYLFYMDNSFYYLRGASLYLYIRSYTNENFKVKFSHLVHLLPFIFLSIFYFFHFHRFNNSAKIRILEKGLFHPYTSFILDIALHLFIVFYLILAAREIYRYKNKLKNALADIFKIWRNWTVFLIGGFFIIMFLDIFYMGLFFYYKIFPYFIVNSLNILVFLLTVLIMFKGLKKPEIFTSIPEIEPSKYLGSKLKESDRIIIRNKLDHLLNNEKIYNNPAICITDLADKLGVLPKHLSQVINEDYKQNFFDLINSFRIEEAKKLLTNYSSARKNILEILYETGFNSKTSFNMAFKKYTGQTPTSYRRLFSKL